jgi:phosphatidylglycerol:prolipoprotein diacylglycerol transferase
MHPVLIRLGPVTIHTYGLLVATGVLLGLWLVRRRAAHSGVDPDRAWNLGVYMTLAALVGAKVWLILQFWSYYAANPREIFALNTLQSAGVFYGGLITAFFVVVFYARYAGLKFLPLADVYAAPLALGHAVGRMGCFSAGCCWGRETQVAWGVTFTDPYAGQLIGVPLGAKLHPTQVYESFALIAIFFVLLRLSKTQRAPGQLFAAYLMLYGVVRAIVEAFRGDPNRTMVFGGAMSLMQVVSLGLILLGALLWWRVPHWQPAPAAAPPPAKRSGRKS